MILTRQSGLGRGLGAIIPPKPPTPPAAPAPAIPPAPPAPVPTPSVSAATTDVASPSVSPDRDGLMEVPLDRIDRNPFQPRQHFDHQQLEDLIASIKEHGLIQPLVVTRKPNGRFELIAGERRLRASGIAGLKNIAVVVRNATEQQKLELALIENIQRQELNPIEEAKAYERLMDEFQLTQEDVGKKVGKSRPQVANTLRLLQLPEEIQKALMEGKISASNGRTLLSLTTDAERLEVFNAMLAQNFTVRQTEDKVRKPRHHRMDDPNVIAAEKRLREALHCKVDIKRDTVGRGEIRLKFTNDEELTAIMERLRAAEEQNTA